jgi:hypothetical protein
LRAIQIMIALQGLQSLFIFGVLNLMTSDMSLCS